MTRLVAQQVVGFYAIGNDDAQRMSIDGGNISFWQASVPGQFHEMDRATVPSSVLVAWQRSENSEDVKWGVTLPATMTRELNEYLNNERGGALVIAANGDIDLRH